MFNFGYFAVPRSLSQIMAQADSEKSVWLKVKDKKSYVPRWGIWSRQDPGHEEYIEDSEAFYDVG